MELKTTKDFENYAKSIISSGEGYLRDLYSVCCRWNIIGKFTHDITFARKCFYDGEKIMRLNFVEIVGLKQKTIRMAIHQHIQVQNTKFSLLKLKQKSV